VSSAAAAVQQLPRHRSPHAGSSSRGRPSNRGGRRLAGSRGAPGCDRSVACTHGRQHCVTLMRTGSGLVRDPSPTVPGQAAGRQQNGAHPPPRLHAHAPTTPPAQELQPPRPSPLDLPGSEVMDASEHTQLVMSASAPSAPQQCRLAYSSNAASMTASRRAVLRAADVAVPQPPSCDGLLAPLSPPSPLPVAPGVPPPPLGCRHSQAVAPESSSRGSKGSAAASSASSLLRTAASSCSCSSVSVERLQD